MRIGIYVAHVGVLPGYERMVSGHVQIPLHTARLLRDAGHDVELISTRLAGRRLPAFVPEGVPLHEVTDASRQGDASEHDVGRRGGFHPLKLARWVAEVRRIVQRCDLVHFFGANRTMSIAGLVRSLPGARPLVATFNVGVFPEPYLWALRPFWRRIDRVLTSTGYFRDRLADAGMTAHVLRHGVVNDLRAPGARPRHRVLFWREATPRNGGDVAREVFRRLAPRFPHISFDFAVRPHWSQVPGLDALAREFPNVHVHATPYAPGITIQSLLAESVCVLLPFRAYTVQPQLSILETLAAGVPVVASDIESTPEVVESGVTGLIVPPADADAASGAVEELLRAPDRARAMGEAAAAFVEREWSWRDYVAGLQRVYESVRRP